MIVRLSPTDQDLFNTFWTCSRPLKQTDLEDVTKQRRADLVAYGKPFSPRFATDKPGTPLPITDKPAVTPRRVKAGQLKLTISPRESGSSAAPLIAISIAFS